MKKITKILALFAVVLYFSIFITKAYPRSNSQYPIFDSTILDCSDVLGGNCIAGVVIKPN